MLFSGADLIKIWDLQAQRAERLRTTEQVKPVASPSQSSPQTKEDTQSALLRFARFVQEQGDQKKKDAKKPPSNQNHPKPIQSAIPAAYFYQIQVTQDVPKVGAKFNV